MAFASRRATPTNRDFCLAIGSEVFAEVDLGPGDCRSSTRPTRWICDSGIYFESGAGLAAVTSDAVNVSVVGEGSRSMKFADRPIIERRSGAFESLDSGFRSDGRTLDHVAGGSGENGVEPPRRAKTFTTSLSGLKSRDSTDMCRPAAMADRRPEPALGRHGARAQSPLRGTYPRYSISGIAIRYSGIVSAPRYRIVSAVCRAEICSRFASSSGFRGMVCGALGHIAAVRWSSRMDDGLRKDGPTPSNQLWTR